MISAFRRYLDTWVVRGFFIIMVLAFVIWGVGDMLRVVGTSTWVAKVGDRRSRARLCRPSISAPWRTATRNLPPGQEASAGAAPAGRRRDVAAADRPGGVRPGIARSAHRHARSRGGRGGARDARLPRPDGQFSRQQFDAVLQTNGLTEARFMELLRGDMAQRQLMGAVTAGAPRRRPRSTRSMPREFEKRSADMAAFPIGAAPEPAAPDEAALQRWYDNHPDLYATPEYRGIKVIVLSPRRWRRKSRHRPGTARRLRAAQGRIHDDRQALGRGDLDHRRGQGAGAGRPMARRRRLGRDAGGGAGRRRVGDRAGRRDRDAVSRSRPRQGGVRAPPIRCPTRSRARSAGSWSG